MPAAPLPPDELARLSVLRDLDLPEQTTDPALQRLTHLAGTVLGVPICLVSAVGESEIWFPGRCGLDAAPWPRAQSFCAHVVSSGLPVVATDLRLDERFADNERVVSHLPPLRFYAGAPIRVQSQVIATLCVMDQRPRPDFDAARLALLMHFSALVGDLLQARLAARQGAQEGALLRDAPMGALTWQVGRDGLQIDTLSANLDGVLGESRVAALRAGQSLASLVHPDDADTVHTGLSSHLHGGVDRLDLQYRLVTEGHRPRWIQQITHAERDTFGQLQRVRGYVFDVSRHKQAESVVEATRERLYLALESARMGTWDLNYATQERTINTRAAAILGLREDELEHNNVTWLDNVHPYDRPKIDEAIQAYREGRTDVIATEYRIRHKRGHYIWVQSFGRTLERDVNGRPRRVVGTLIDITDAKQQETVRHRQRQLLDLLNQAQTAFLLKRNAHDACEALFRPLLRISECSFGFIGIVQQRPDGQIGLSLPSVSDDVDPSVSELPDLNNLFGQVVRDNQQFTANHPPARHGSNALPAGFPALQNFLGLPIRFDNRVVGMIGLGNRADGFDEQLVQLLEPLVVSLGTLFHARELEAARVKAEEELVRLASRDALTGLVNRRQFFEVAEAVLAQTRRYGSPMTVALLDLDHFKHINDTHGHAAGDAVLKAFAEVLHCSLRDSDTPARIGGEEFAVLLTSTPLVEALTALERIRQTLQDNPIVVGGQRIAATVSIGAVQWNPAHFDVDAMLAHADAALYAAKRAGRNRVQLYHHDLPGADDAPPTTLRAANDAA
ncbi:diguanylate cyclase [Aquabacterium fontiphilum]|jgi:diguanylate cyclase (GGDEF)-like protein/PAS domain S-box-containing protein|uniref:sensor domain-containing diguanylate cyclase n=1 Tax=Aquabacterium fontiphilum TaxID=450365 RepID=UPI0013770706|nr:diguanylate cyclase [Aquabacterium fontiphilum]NBD20301.1 diguanylate cyclase [Aquabacterium fontiphilum]